ncbi:hypothetical protein, partial [Microcoleus sp. SVA1_A1]|uniref:hypothetical protein n=1 Tax=Microcoleus sp. SVA1_A1 TaxID=2818946 RepID=UPI002FD12F03
LPRALHNSDATGFDITLPFSLSLSLSPPFSPILPLSLILPLFPIRIFTSLLTKKDKKKRELPK